MQLCAIIHGACDRFVRPDTSIMGTVTKSNNRFSQKASARSFQWRSSLHWVLHVIEKCTVRIILVNKSYAPESLDAIVRLLVARGTFHSTKLSPWFWRVISVVNNGFPRSCPKTITGITTEDCTNDADGSGIWSRENDGILER